MTSLLTGIKELEIQFLLKKIRYNNYWFHVLCLHRAPTFINGNKAWKMLYNLQYALDNQLGILTFGGAFSNHLYQTAKACHRLGISSVGLVRGEFDESNPTIMAIRKSGMQLQVIDRSDYRNFTQNYNLKEVESSYPNYHIVPEGGSNHLASKGVGLLAKKIEVLLSEIDLDEIALSVGTGGTMVGLIDHMSAEIKISGYAALKGDFLYQMIQDKCNTSQSNWTISDDVAFGGFGKWDSRLVDFVKDFFEETGVLLDPIYTGKMFYRAMTTDQTNDRTLFIHTGGLQGIRGFNYRFNLNLPTAEQA